MVTITKIFCIWFLAFSIGEVLSAKQNKQTEELQEKIKKTGYDSLTQQEKVKAFKANLVSNFYTGPPHCFNNWIKIVNFDSCYTVIDKKLSWENARDYCRDHGGALATISTVEEMVNISRYVYEANASGDYHLGYISKNGTIEDSEFFTVKKWWKQQVETTDIDENKTCVKTSKKAGENFSNPELVSCAMSETSDEQSKFQFLCKMPDSKCMCTKVNEPVLRNFNGTYFGLKDQTEYILYSYLSTIVTMLIWQNETSVINSKHYAFDGNDLPVAMLSIFASKLEYNLAYQEGELKFFANATLKAGSDKAFSFKDKNINFLYDKNAKTANLSTVDGNVQIIYDGVNFILYAKPTTISTGLCGKCSKFANATEILSIEKHVVSSKSELSESYVNSRVLWPWQVPIVDTCIAANLRHAAATVCRPLFDITLFFGNCLVAKQKTRAKMEKFYYQECMARVCEGGPLAACQFFEILTQLCKFNNSYKDEFNCKKTKPCPEQYIYNSNGFCYLIAKLPDQVDNQFDNYFPPTNETGFPWHTASDICHRKGAQLASITTIADHLFIHYFIRSKLPDDEDFWIGAVVDPERQAAFWSDGSSMSFEAWDNDTRSWAENKDKRCAVFNTNSSWSVRNCNGVKSDNINPTSALCQIRSYGEILCSGFPCIPPKECLNGSCVLPAVKVKCCEPDPCMNGGTCYTRDYAGSGYFCACPSNLFGPRCERTRDSPSVSMIPDQDYSLVNTNPIKPKRACPSPEWFSVENGDCYMIIPEKVAWETARENCRDFGGYLAVINSETEMKQIAEAKKELSNGQYHVGYIFYGGKRYVESAPIDFEKYLDFYLTGVVASGCATANPSQNTFQFRMCANSKSKDAGYLCKRDTDKCRCGKWNEPVVRTFNGNRVPVERNTEYLLYTVPEKFSVAIYVNDTNAGYLSLSYKPDIVPSIQMVIIEMYETNVTCFITQQGGVLSTNCPDNLNVFNITSSTTGLFTGIIVSSFDGSMSVFYDGKNVELSVEYRLAQRSKPGTGMCGMCDDRQRSELYSSSQIKIVDKHQFADNWVVGRDIWPTTRNPVLSCISETMLTASVSRCSVFYDITNTATGDCLIKKLVKDFILADLYEKCLFDVCLYGPLGMCPYLEQIADLCKIDKNEAFTQFKCGSDNLCPSKSVSNNNRCYTQSTELFSKIEAQNYCHSAAKTLAIISDNAEFAFFDAQISGDNWIGALIEPDFYITFWEDGSQQNLEDFWNARYHNNFTCTTFNNRKAQNNDHCLKMKKQAVCSSLVGLTCGDSHCFPGQKCMSGICQGTVQYTEDCEKTPCKNDAKCTEGQCVCQENLAGSKCETTDPGIATTVTMPPEITEAPLQVATAADELDVTTTVVPLADEQQNNI